MLNVARRMRDAGQPEQYARYVNYCYFRYWNTETQFLHSAHPNKQGTRNKLFKLNVNKSYTVISIKVDDHDFITYIISRLCSSQIMALV